MTIKKLTEYCKEFDVIKLLDIPMIQELISVRNKLLKEVKAQGYLEDVWNIKQYLEKEDVKKDIYGNNRFFKRRWSGSVLATVIQSIEMEVISGAFQYMKDKEYDAQIMLFQHDGFCLSITTQKEINPVKEGLMKSIRDKAKEVGLKLDCDLSDMALEIEQL